MAKQAKEGSFLKISLNDDSFIYGRIVPDKCLAVYDARTKEELRLDEVQSKSILFIVPVYHKIFKSGRWPVIGYLPIEDKLKIPPPFFLQDALNLNNISVYYNGQTRKASYEECLGMERMAVWDIEHVESRINDLYEGKPNFWVENFKVKSVV